MTEPMFHRMMEVVPQNDGSLCVSVSLSDTRHCVSKSLNQCSVERKKVVCLLATKSLFKQVNDGSVPRNNYVSFLLSDKRFRVSQPPTQ